jgi:hypothetical protein
MAQIVRAPRPERRVDHDIERLLAFSRTVPEFAAEWPEWDDCSREDFRIEWTIDRERLHRVTTAAKAGILDERQQRDWQELQQLVETHRATVEWMLEGPI